MVIFDNDRTIGFLLVFTDETRVPWPGNYLLNDY
jgi:hypothetical protein